MELNSKADAESWLRVTEQALAQDESTPADERMSCRTLLEMVVPLVRKVAEVLT